MKSPIITAIALFIAINSIPTASIQAQTFVEKESFSFSETNENKSVLVNSDITNYLNKKIVVLAKGDRVGNGFSLRDGGEVVGLISKSSEGNGAGNFAAVKHRGGNG